MGLTNIIHIFIIFIIKCYRRPAKTTFHSTEESGG